MKFVLDCSVTMAWCFEDECNTYTENILTSLQKDAAAIVPPLWRLEVINVLLIAQRKKRIPFYISNNFKNLLSILPIHIDLVSTDRIFDSIYELANELQLTAYDATYLELALRLKIPLATQNTALINAAKKIHVSVL